MAWGPLIRIVAQVVRVAGGAAGRAVRDAYREAAKNPKVATAVGNKKMSVDEATKILDVVQSFSELNAAKAGEEASLCAKSIASKAETMRAINQVDAKGIGSPYLQSKVSIAEVILLEELKRRAKKAAL
ncbi:unnamed protein product [Amoebophrya sp. A25]|nr:unnamed protein product [Amoebophrya sp. A25]|eukprot:GSA25T00026697001.1